MGRREIRIEVCDRCTKETPAVTKVIFSYEGHQYYLDLCEKHNHDYERDLLGWVRIASEVEEDEKARRHQPTPIPVRKQLEPPAGLYADTGEPGPARIVPTPPKRQVIVLPESPEVVPYDHVDGELRPTRTALDAAAALGLTWAAVLEAVDMAGAVLPSMKREDIQIYLSGDLSILIADNGTIIGIAERDPRDMPAREQHAPTPAHKIVRKGKRGGQGHLGPRSIKEVYKLLAKAPGWRLEHGGKHYKAYGPDGAQATIPITPSDYRTTLNVVSQLRHEGLDLRELAAANH